MLSYIQELCFICFRKQRGNDGRKVNAHSRPKTPEKSLNQNFTAYQNQFFSNERTSFSAVDFFHVIGHIQEVVLNQEIIITNINILK